MTTVEKTLGQIAYEGYYNHTNGKTWNGYQMPDWDGLTDGVRAAWQAGAVTVQQRVLHGVVNMMQAAIAEQEAEKAGHA